MQPTLESGEGIPFAGEWVGFEDEADFFSIYNRRPRGPSAEEDLMLMPQPYHRASAATRTVPALFLPTCGTCVSAHSTVSPSRSLTVRDVVVTVDDINWIEKNTTQSVNVTVSGAGGGITTRIRISTGSGTGSATFDDGSVEKVIVGNTVPGSPVVLTIKGVTESSTVNNLELKATIDWLSTPKKIDPFSVAAITGLAFERINTTGTGNVPDVPMDNNPGNGQPDTNVGQRIFPDKNAPDDTTDRATLRVRATVMPANVPNLRVYFAGFDLDDPSADTAPIDANEDGVDNNGAVNGSKSGEFSSAAGVMCSNAMAGADPLFIARIDCPVAGNTTAANFKVTMQPGDNFAIAASLDGAYRDGVRVNTAAGTNLTDNAGQTIPISGQTNPNNVRGIRTNMLTVWRRLHIELDSMGPVAVNSISGVITGAGVTVCPPNPPTPCTENGVYFVQTTSMLEANRFEGGRIVFSPTKSFKVIANSATVTGVESSIFLEGQPTGWTNVSSGEQFTLFDDDDFDDDDGNTMDGDNGENIDPPPITLVASTDSPCPDVSTASNCNVFAAAYVKPFNDLAGSETLFVPNVNVSTVTADPAPVEIQVHFQFANIGTEANQDFWTVYLNGAYQHDVRRDGDGEGTLVSGIVDALNGQGALIYMEVTRPQEFGNIWNLPGVTRNHTVAHELGHLFFGTHTDTGVMQPPNSRTSGIFGVETLNKIRGGEFVFQGTTRRITHP